MKIIENKETWDLLLSLLDEVIKMQIEKAPDSEMVKEKCRELAQYTYERDIKTGVISENKLKKDEREGKIFGSHIFVRLARHYFLLEKITGIDYTAHRRLANNIHAYLGNQYYYKVDKDVIKQLLISGRKYPEEFPEYDRTDKYLNQMAEAATLLRQYGMTVEVSCGTLSYDDKVNEEIFRLLDTKIELAGGNYVLKEVYDQFISEYFASLDHYNISRKIDQEQNEPVHLLLNLAVKHLSIPAKTDNLHQSKLLYEESLGIARAWLDIMDIQGSSGVEYAMLNLDVFSVYLNNEIVFDKMCIPRQYSKKFILKMMEYLIKPWFDRAEKKYTYTDYYKVAEYIMDLHMIGSVLDISEMKKKLKMANYKIKLILKDISLQSYRVNHEFTSLDGQVNFYKRPLIEFPLDRYMYIDYHLCGYGFYLAAHDMIKEKYPLLDKIQGPYVEEMLRSEIRKKGYFIQYGKYEGKSGLNQSDCDLIMKGKRIYFFEVKKRSLSDEFDKLDDVAALRQLAFGMVNAQRQCFCHERYLHKNSEIVLIHDDKSKDLLTYEADRLPAYKISVCLPEYSFLTSKPFSTCLLETILRGSFQAVDPSQQWQLDKINEIGEKIAECQFDIENEKKFVARDAVFYSLFCSMQQLLTALWCSHTEAEFLEMTRDWIYTSDKSLNPYYQLLLYIYYREHPDEVNIKKSAIDMMEKNHQATIYTG